MTINLSVPQTMQELRPRITVVGVGGAGGNAVNNMINADLDGVDFLVANTDGQALAHSLASRKIQLGTAVTQGLGAGSKPDVGRAAAEESIEAVMSELADCNMVFITAGMGGGTGTGAAPVIARAARERGILTVGVVTKPFDFEGQRRMGQAEAGIEEMQSFVDTLIVIPNQNLFRLANERTTFADAFHMADTVLHQGVAGVTDLMIKPGQINLDFADIRAVMSEMGKAMMGTGEASGEGRATQAAEAAINNPLLDDISMNGARAVLINVTGGMDMTLFEVDEAANRIRREIDADSVIIFGSTFDEKLDGVMRVSIVATGIEAAGARRETPTFIQAPTTRRSTVISAPTAAAPTPAAARSDTPAETATNEAPATADAEAELPEAPAAPDQVLAETGSSKAELPETADISDDESVTKTEPYVPAFVPTKASRLAFLSTGRTAPRELPVPRRAAGDSAEGDADQMSLEDAINSDRAVAFGSGMPARTEAKTETTADGLDEANAAAPHENAVEGTGERAAESSADKTADKVLEPVMVSDSAAELATRRPFVPAAPAEMPDAEAVPEAAPAGSKTSLINKISGLWTNKAGEEASQPRVEPAVETAGVSDSAPKAPAAPAAPSILDLPRADVMSRMPEPASTTALDSKADDLEIPAFLRRQAN